MLKDRDSFIRISFEPNDRFGWNLKMAQIQLKTINISVWSNEIQ